MEVPYENIKAGMITEKAILDKNGRIVIKAGTALTPLLLKRLKIWGVQSICVDMPDELKNKSEDKSENKKISDKEKKQDFDKELVVRIAKKFTNVRHEPLMDKIMRLAIKNLSSRQAKSEE